MGNKKREKQKEIPGWENQNNLTHFEAPKRKQRCLQPFHAILLLQFHPSGSFSDNANHLPTTEGIFETAISKKGEI